MITTINPLSMEERGLQKLNNVLGCKSDLQIKLPSFSLSCFESKNDLFMAQYTRGKVSHITDSISSSLEYSFLWPKGKNEGKARQC